MKYPYTEFTHRNVNWAWIFHVTLNKKLLTHEIKKL
jgi:hypothetical protein